MLVAVPPIILFRGPMNFDEAIVAHSTWKRKLREYLAKPDQSLKVSEVGANNKCKLGQWIAGEGREYASLPEFTKLNSEHTRFHKAAADLVRRADNGESVLHEVGIDGTGEFLKTTTHVIAAIAALKQKVQGGDGGKSGK